ncbi:hypothetical protein [Tateyamaria pelophila]|uniref:hypothetical protein n=1 Tax=Tateyamaria pelophila TaxID=328415 RepID=UPI001CBB9F68|nr:hypothetical protein [Tateyamaria pelophila]
MSAKTLQFLNTLARAFEENRLLTLAHSFSFPMATYVHDGLLVFGAPATLVEALEEYRNMALANGVARLEPRIIAEGIPLNRRTDTWVEWDHLDKDGVCLRTNQVRFVVRRPLGGADPLIEMVDYKVTAFPELAAHLPLAMPA